MFKFKTKLQPTPVYFSDENHKERHVDKDIRSPIPKAMLHHMWDPHRDIQDPGHDPGRHFAREYARASLAVVRLRANATIGESVPIATLFDCIRNIYIYIYILKYMCRITLVCCHVKFRRCHFKYGTPQVCAVPFSNVVQFSYGLWFVFCWVGWLVFWMCQCVVCRF